MMVLEEAYQYVVDSINLSVHWKDNLKYVLGPVDRSDGIPQTPIPHYAEAIEEFKLKFKIGEKSLLYRCLQSSGTDQCNEDSPEITPL